MYREHPRFGAESKGFHLTEIQLSSKLSRTTGLWLWHGTSTEKVIGSDSWYRFETQQSNRAIHAVEKTRFWAHNLWKKLDGSHYQVPCFSLCWRFPPLPSAVFFWLRRSVRDSLLADRGRSSKWYYWSRRNLHLGRCPMLRSKKKERKKKEE